MDLNPHQLSFRDPSGRVFRRGNRILREVESSVEPILIDFIGTLAAQQLVTDGLLIGTRRLSEAEREEALPGSQALVVEHPAIPFPSYPYEWSSEMLLAAGRATLSLALRLLEQGRGLKDASAYNVLFDGYRPVFIDLLSVEQRQPGDSRWLPYAQFQRHFVLPLLASKHFGVSLAQSFLCNRDGLEPESLYPMMGFRRRLLPPFLGLVSLPTWFGERRRGYNAKLYKPAPSVSTEQARFVLSAALKHLDRQLRAGASTRVAPSTWSNYMLSKTYSDAAFEAKTRFVREALAHVCPKRVLDVGCNTGHFSRLSTEAGAGVVAIDIDPAVLDTLYRSAVESRLNILPLNVDLSLPTPPMGWRNQERASFLDRARGHFDMVLALAVLHHMLVTDRVPLDEALSCIADLTRDAVVIEFVEPADEMFRQIARGRDDLFAELTRERFEIACARRFEVVRRQGPLNGTRWLYLLRRKDHLA